MADFSKKKSVFFTQDNGFTVQQTTASEAKNRWKEAANFEDGIKTPVVEVPRLENANPEVFNDSEVEDEIFDDSDTAQIISKPRGPRRLLSQR